MTAPAVSVHGIEKSYAGLPVLRGVDFEVEPGSVFALLGSNGAGKTTLIRILSTLLKADAGTASVRGFDVASQPRRVRESISLTGQFAAVDELLTGREHPHRRLSGRDARVPPPHRVIGSRYVGRLSFCDTETNEHSILILP